MNIRRVTAPPRPEDRPPEPMPAPRPARPGATTSAG